MRIKLKAKVRRKKCKCAEMMVLGGVTFESLRREMLTRGGASLAENALFAQEIRVGKQVARRSIFQKLEKDNSKTKKDRVRRERSRKNTHYDFGMNIWYGFN